MHSPHHPQSLSRPKTSTPDLTFITHAASGVRLEKLLTLTPDHPAALTFCILGTLTDPVVLTSPCPHLMIYHGLQKCATDPDSRHWRAHLEEYQTKLHHGRLTAERLLTFQLDCAASHGFPRYRTISGRLWNPLRITEMGTFSVLSLWPDPERPLELESLERIGQLLGWKLPAWICAKPLHLWMSER